MQTTTQNTQMLMQMMQQMQANQAYQGVPGNQGNFSSSTMLLSTSSWLTILKLSVTVSTLLMLKIG